MVQQYCVILTTTDNKQVINDIANGLLTNKLASCVQIDEVESHFKWKDEISIVKEYRAMIKAPSDNYKKIEAVIMSIHNYKIPQIIKLDITDGLKSYLDWLAI